MVGILSITAHLTRTLMSSLKSGTTSEHARSSQAVSLTLCPVRDLLFWRRAIESTGQLPLSLQLKPLLASINKMSNSSPEFLIEGILPAGEAHLIGGASGSGKTTWIFQNFLAEWQQGNQVFEHDSHPVPYVYVSLDRSRSSVTRTLQRLKLLDKIIRVICLDEMPEECLDLDNVLKFALKKYPDSKLIIIEGFALMSGEKTNGYTAVGKLMRKAARLCAKQKITIIGVCHAPKLKADEQFQHSRELLLGSVAWAAYSDTIVVLNMDEQTKIITVKVMPRNAAIEEHGMQFGLGGRLETAIKGSKLDFLSKRLQKLPPGRPITRNEVVQWAEKYHIHFRTAENAISVNVKNGILTSLERGLYERSQLSSPVLDPENDLNVDL